VQDGTGADRDEPTELLPVTRAAAGPQPITTGRWYHGRRRQRTGPLGWLRGLGTAPMALLIAVLVGLLTGLGWWAGGGRVASPPPPGPLPVGSIHSGDPAADPPAGSGSPSLRGTPSARPKSKSPSAVATVPSLAPSPTGSPSPSPPPPPQRTRYEAEWSSIGNGTVATDHSGYSGSGFVDYANAAGSFVEWRVSVPAAGQVTLTFRYSNGGGDNRPLDVTVNGAPAQRGLTFPPTGDWARWAGRTLVVVVPAGASVIRATAVTGAGGPDMDCLDVQT
jgi:hypothetical protein